MTILRRVEQKLDNLPHVPEYDLEDALAEAEVLADLFADVQPQPYVVPIERFAGLPVYEQRKKA